MKWLKSIEEKIKKHEIKIKKYTFMTCAIVVVCYIGFVASKVEINFDNMIIEHNPTFLSDDAIIKEERENEYREMLVRNQKNMLNNLWEDVYDFFIR